MPDTNGKEYLDCIVGNIIGNHFFGEQKEIKSGTKRFSDQSEEKQITYLICSVHKQNL
jgi:hypothetical protein